MDCKGHAAGEGTGRTRVSLLAGNLSDRINERKGIFTDLGKGDLFSVGFGGWT